MVKVKTVLPEFDGGLLDNIIDYVTYVMVPAFMILIGEFVPESLRLITGCIIVFSSAYQFCQVEAKTEDHFFKGFPSYWNIAVYYLFLSNFSPWLNFWILIIPAILVFIPIKFVYPSRLDYLTSSPALKYCTAIATVLWGLASFLLLIRYPEESPLLIGYIILYMCFYLILSLYRTWFPLRTDIRSDPGG